MITYLRKLALVLDVNYLNGKMFNASSFAFVLGRRLLSNYKPTLNSILSTTNTHAIQIMIMILFIYTRFLISFKSLHIAQKHIDSLNRKYMEELN